MSSAPEFRTGTNTFRLSSSAVDSRAPIDRASVAESTFTSRGTLNTLQEDVLSVRTVIFKEQLEKILQLEICRN